MALIGKDEELRYQCKITRKKQKILDEIDDYIGQYVYHLSLFDRRKLKITLTLKKVNNSQNLIDCLPVIRWTLNIQTSIGDKEDLEIIQERVQFEFEE